jgi:hypothetical protein
MEVLTCDWKAAEAPPRLECLCLSDSGRGRNDNRVEDEAVLETLDLAHHLGLIVLRAVVVNDTKTTQQCNVNRHVVLGDCVHGRRDEGCLYGNALRDRGIEVDIYGGEA